MLVNPVRHRRCRRVADTVAVGSVESVPGPAQSLRHESCNPLAHCRYLHVPPMVPVVVKEEAR
eukprot:7273437-Prorocentrum_lima.AAC.1